MRSLVRDEITMALDALRAQGWTLPTAVEVPLDRPKRAEHGDVASNVAMGLARTTGRKPRDVAQALAQALQARIDVGAGPLRAVEIAGPGFLNLRVHDAAFHAVMADVLARGAAYGRGEPRPGTLLVEFVSANPTGPLHVAHARGAMVGDALVRVLRAAGHTVATEYYVNDAGQKVINLAWTVRSLVHGQRLWAEAYRGEYVHALAAEVRAARPELVADPVTFEDPAAADAALKPTLHAQDRALAAECVARQMAKIRHTLTRLGLRFDRFFSEQALIEDGTVPALLADWLARGLAEERDGAVFFRAAASGEDDKDRVLRKSSGDFTYFATDIGYHRDKLARGFAHLIDVWGADHHGYIARMRAALEALGLPREAFEVLLMQMVALVKDGAPYRMSKTSGTFVTIDEILDEIDAAAQHEGAGRDALRYFLLSRSSDSPMEIDIDLAKKQSVENPVFYAQMGHARMAAILDRARTAPEFEAARAQGLLAVPTGWDAALAARLTLAEERDLLGLCDLFPQVVREAAEHRAPHRVCFFVQELAQAFASYYTRLQKVHRDAVLPQKGFRESGDDWVARWDWEKTRARLLWVATVKQVYANALELLGVEAPERMVRLAAVVADDDAAAGDGGAG